MAQAALTTYVCVLALFVSVSADVLQPGGEVGSGGPLLLMNVTVPVCMQNEFLTSDGNQLSCRPLPEPVCDCPTTNEVFGSGDDALIPLPPEGCQMFLPPTRGAFICMRLSDVIYCSVLCDHRFEFNLSPRNPYYCGADTGFRWLDRTNQPRSQLPDCTGFRHRQRLLHPYEFYLPAPCYGLNEHTTLGLMEEFYGLVVKLGCDPDECDLNDVYLQCPSVDATAQFYDEILLRRPYYRKK